MVLSPVAGPSMPVCYTPVRWTPAGPRSTKIAQLLGCELLVILGVVDMDPKIHMGTTWNDHEWPPSGQGLYVFFLCILDLRSGSKVNHDYSYMIRSVIGKPEAISSSIQNTAGDVSAPFTHNQNHHSSTWFLLQSVVTPLTIIIFHQPWAIIIHQHWSWYSHHDLA